MNVGKVLDSLQARFGKYASLLALGMITIVASIVLLRCVVKPYRNHEPIPPAFESMLKAKERLDYRQSPYQPPLDPVYAMSPGALVPVQALPKEPREAWFWVSLVSVLGWMAVLALSCGQWSIKTVILLAFGLGLSIPGMVEILDQGQLDLFLFVVAGFGAYFVNKVPILSGLLIGTLPWFRLQWVILFLPFILVVTQKRRWRLAQFFMGYFLASLAWGAGLPNITFGSDRGLELSRQWLEVLRDMRVTHFFESSNQSLWISLHRWLGEASFLTYGLVLMVFGVLLGRMVARSREVRPYGGELAWISPWLMVVQLMNPVAWKWANVFVVGMPLAFAQGKWVNHRGVRAALYASVLGLMALVQYGAITRAAGFGPHYDLMGFGGLTLEWLLLLILCL